MKNKMFRMSEEEKQAFRIRAEEIVNTIGNAEDIRKGLIGYLEANGYSEEEAVDLIDNVIMGTVDDYNASCKEAMEVDIETWIMEKMDASIEKQGLDEQEAAKYKMRVFLAFRTLDAKAVGEEELLTEEEQALLDATEYTSEMMLEIDELLVESIKDSAMPFYMTEAFENFLNSNADEENIRVVTNELWEDSKLKYSAATALCVAHRNGELPSIPEEVSDTQLVLAACQGIDVINIEAQVSTGEMMLDKAYKILKVIGAVVLTIGAWGLILVGVCDLACITVDLVVELLGTGFLGFVTTLALLFPFFMVVSSPETMEYIWAGVKQIGKCTDIAYSALKRGAKMLYHYTVENIKPVVEAGVTKVKEFVQNVVFKVRQFIRKRVGVSVHA